ncbi:MAG: hypothetical protein Q8N56_01850 [bacterium]|nr:hypothetical protein [bacterium]
MSELFHKHGLDEDSATIVELIEKGVYELRAEEREIREKSLARIPATNECKFSDAQLQELSDFWFMQRTIASVSDKDRIGFAYISKALGLGDEVAKKFIKGDRRAFYRVGRARLKRKKLKVWLFWKEVWNIFPNDYCEEDINFLCQLSLEAVTHFLYQIETLFAEDSKVLASLFFNENHYVVSHIR